MTSQATSKSDVKQAALKISIEQLAREQGKTEIEIITALQAAAAKTGDEKLLNRLCLLKRKYIKF